MKNYLQILLLLLMPFYVCGQKIDFQNSLNNATELAIKKNKFILVCIESPNSVIANIGGLNNPTVVEMINKNFVTYKTSFTKSDASELIRKYPHIDKFPAFVFLHKNKELFYADFGSSANSSKYVKMMNDALAASTQKTLADYEKEYLENKNITTLKAFIDFRKKQGIKDNASLIEQYVSLLSVADFNKYETVLYILEAGPYLDGNAYKFSRTNPKLFDSVYRKEPLQNRVAINNVIIANNMSMAIKVKNPSKASIVANFVRGTWTNDYQRGAKASEAEMLRYYRAVKDTAQYFRSAINYYDRYYMNISADSIKKLEAKDRQAMTERMRLQLPNSTNQVSKAKIDSLSKLPGTVRRVEMVTSTPFSALSYANELNNIASIFYGTGTKNLNHLTKALIWSKRSIELKPFWGYYDTLAHVYYAMGIYTEAVATQKIAVERARTDQPDAVERSQKEYEKMKNRTL